MWCVCVCCWVCVSGVVSALTNTHASCAAWLHNRYKNDPTILAWNLINEPRCETWIPQNSWCHEKVADWYKVRERQSPVSAAAAAAAVCQGWRGEQQVPCPPA
jgi:hypothetical protein